jgi:putative serine protease PepD
LRISPRIIAAAVTTVALLTLAGCGGSTKTVTVTTSGVPAGQSSLEQKYVSVIARFSPEVVQISTSQGLGSGVALDTRGDVVTNAHVVAGGGPVQLTDSRGRRYSASLIGVFTPDDLAVVRAQGASLSPASFADSSKLKVGEIVLAIGNPLGCAAR